MLSRDARGLLEELLASCDEALAFAHKKLLGQWPKSPTWYETKGTIGTLQSIAAGIRTTLRQDG